MKILDFIFALILKFVPMAPGEFAKLKDEAELDFASVRTDDMADKKGIKFYVKKYTEKWEVRLVLACFYIFAVKWINDFMNPAGFEEEDED